ncbi:unnamed protein product [Ranitomeya imitator]|uniref:Reverse transcriptase domain-containing protein n=1 Tax=Ranitomeya imitator TaxID=111125 RepID=A0ABN9MFI8_9NEOB|nr:unnamed protein product [Ranitomeya imitator]
MSSETFFYNATEAADIVSRVTASSDFLQIPPQELKNRDLERESKRAVNLELHTLTIAEYLKVQRIPRGLRVPLQPTFFKDDKDYYTKFEHILNKCSFDLMTLTLSFFTEEFGISQCPGSGDRNPALEFYAPGRIPGGKKQKNQKTLQSFRRELEKRKRTKFLRDTEDYQQNRIYQGRDTKPLLQTLGIPKLLQFSRQQTWLYKHPNHYNFFRVEPPSTKRKTRPGGQCHQENKKQRDDTIPGRQLPLRWISIFLIGRYIRANYIFIRIYLQKRGQLLIYYHLINRWLLIRRIRGGAVVIMDKRDYMEEILRQLSDTQVYKVVPHNPKNSIVVKLNAIADDHIQRGTIDKKLKEFLCKSDPITPVFYILPKRLHKPPGCQTVSSSDSILSPLMMVLEKMTTPLVKKCKSFLLDTGKFIRLIKSLGPLPPSSLLATWDGLRATERLLTEANLDPLIRHFCSDLLNLVLRENYFMFQDTFYVQLQGTAMGSHVAPPYVVAYMAAHEDDFIYTCPLFQQHSVRYIDDIFCIWDGPFETLLTFDKYINDIWPELKFTLSCNTDTINFLDTLVCKDGESQLSIDFYIKDTDRNGLLHYTSFHLPTVKKIYSKIKISKS